jgi:hypothetical protein
MRCGWRAWDVGAMSFPDRELSMNLIPIDPKFIDFAWKEGAHNLAEACDTSGGEITGDQLKMLLARGERTLIRMEDEGETIGWGVVRADNLPNVRVLHVCEMYAPNASFERFFEELKKFAAHNGCSEVRCSAKDAQARLYRMKCGFEPIYTTMRAAV